MLRRRLGRIARVGNVRNLKRLMVVLLAAVLLVGCGYKSPSNSIRYHVWCYQYGKLVISRIVIQEWYGLDYYWKDEQTSGKVLFPSPTSGAACAWLGLPDAE